GPSRQRLLRVEVILLESNPSCTTVAPGIGELIWTEINRRDAGGGPGVGHKPGDAPETAADFEDAPHGQPAALEHIEKEALLQPVELRRRASLVDVAAAAFEPVFIDIKFIGHGCLLRPAPVKFRRGLAVKLDQLLIKPPDVVVLRHELAAPLPHLGPL